MTKSTDLSGARFSSLVVKGLAGTNPRRWLCLCDCGRTTEVRTSHLTSGHTKSCGCRRVSVGQAHKTHGMRDRPEYAIWSKMRDRCQNPRNPSYQKYGGRGVSVCPEWEDFAVFMVDMGDRPTPKHTLERVDVDGDYCVSNVIWTDDMSRQAFNQNLKSNNTSGKSGVYWRKDRRVWVAETFHSGKYIMHGSFKNFEDAVRCRKDAEIRVYGMEKPDGMG